MGSTADEVYAAALALEVAERAAVAHRLLAAELLAAEPVGNSTDQAEIDTAWSAEIDLRIEAILSGTVELEPFTTTRAKARAILNEVRG